MTYTYTLPPDTLNARNRLRVPEHPERMRNCEGGRKRERQRPQNLSWPPSEPVNDAIRACPSPVWNPASTKTPVQREKS